MTMNIIALKWKSLTVSFSFFRKEFSRFTRFYLDKGCTEIISAIVISDTVTTMKRLNFSSIQTNQQEKRKDPAAASLVLGLADGGLLVVAGHVVPLDAVSVKVVEHGQASLEWSGAEFYSEFIASSKKHTNLPAAEEVLTHRGIWSLRNISFMSKCLFKTLSEHCQDFRLITCLI